MLDPAHERYKHTPLQGPEGLVSVLLVGALMQLLMTHGEARQAAALSTSVAKMLRSVANGACRRAKEVAGAGGSSSSGSSSSHRRGTSEDSSAASGISGGSGSSGSNGGSGGGSSEGSGGGGSGGSGGSGVSATAYRRPTVVARAFVVQGLDIVADGAHCTLSSLVLPLARRYWLAHGRRRPLFPTATAVLSATATAGPNTPCSSSSGGCAGAAPLSLDGGGVAGPSDVEKVRQRQAEQFTRLVGFALPRWLRMSVHLIDTCDRQHVEVPGGASTTAGMRLTVKVPRPWCSTRATRHTGRATGRRWEADGSCCTTSHRTGG